MQNKKLILFGVFLFIIFLIFFGFLAHKEYILLEPKKQIQTSDASSDWKTYTNKKDGYSIQYPRDWDIREFKVMGGGDGVAFHPLNLPSNPMNEFIEIEMDVRGFSMGNAEDPVCRKPFLNYLKEDEMKDLGIVDSLEKISNNNNVESYKITWYRFDLNGNSYTDNVPIAYFDSGLMDCRLPKVFLINTAYINTYNEMIKTFKFIK